MLALRDCCFCRSNARNEEAQQGHGSAAAGGLFARLMAIPPQAALQNGTVVLPVPPSYLANFNVGICNVSGSENLQRHHSGLTVKQDSHTRIRINKGSLLVSIATFVPTMVPVFTTLCTELVNLSAVLYR
jgi:hypothetical protein